MEVKTKRSIVVVVSEKCGVRPLDPAMRPGLKRLMETNEINTGFCWVEGMTRVMTDLRGATRGKGPVKRGGCQNQVD